ncbi:haloacid dehalogenase [Diplodia corticola]|uniref:Haloacid dehalogenase n=1 Tax=Diplodia corticola TaxID=236234 RepID=A0A1J9RKF4_9PEZI|nr:haloacid dehalogenase [Diplodia corticola]OJD28999.1 haloacid dehalogenase [Diplodia corticola]
MPYFNSDSVEEQKKPDNMGANTLNDCVCPAAPKMTNVTPAPFDSSPSIPDCLPEVQELPAGLKNAMPRSLSSAPVVPDCLPEVQDPTVGLTATNISHPHPGVTGVTVTTPTTITVQLPLLTLLNPSASTTSLRRHLLAAHLRADPVLLLPSADGVIHLAANYPSAGQLDLDTALSGPATPFTTTPLDSDHLRHLRRFTFLVPTHKGWKGDNVLQREQLVDFLFSDAVLLGPNKADAPDDDPLAVQRRWFRAQAREQAGQRREWTAAVRRCVRTLAGGLASALFADGEVGDEARGEVRGEVVFQEWCDGWGQKRGADAVMVAEVEGVVGKMERCYGRRLWRRLEVPGGTVEGGWAWAGAEEMGEVGEMGEMVEMEG